MMGIANLKDRWVNFRVRDVHVPSAEEVLHQLYGTNILQGRVIDVSDDGTRASAFAVVQVEGLSSVLVVPVERILSVV